MFFVVLFDILIHYKNALTLQKFIIISHTFWVSLSLESAKESQSVKEFGKMLDSKCESHYSIGTFLNKNPTTDTEKRPMYVFRYLINRFN